MRDEQKEHYFRVLVEHLYSGLRATMHEPTDGDKKQRCLKMILEFYDKYKEEYEINGIKDITDIFEELNKNMKKINPNDKGLEI